MNRHKIGAFTRLDHYGPEAVRLGQQLADARTEREDAESDLRRLMGAEALADAQRREQQIADEAYRLTGSAGFEGPRPTEQLAADRATAAARLRAAEGAEASADSALFAELAANIDQAVESTRRQLADTIEAHQANLAAVARSRAQMLEAEQACRYIDGLRNAADFVAGRRDRHETSRPEYVFPIRSASRPPQRIDQRIVHAGNSHVADIDRGLAAMRTETELVTIGIESEAPPVDVDQADDVIDQADNTPKPPSRDNRFRSDLPKPGRRQRVRAAS